MASQLPPEAPEFSQGGPSHVTKRPSPGLAIASLVIGIIGVGAWCIPICGVPLNIGGLVMGAMGMKSTNRGMAIAGIVLNVLALIAGIVNAAYGAYLGATGQHPLLQ